MAEVYSTVYTVSGLLYAGLLCAGQYALHASIVHACITVALDALDACRIWRPWTGCWGRPACMNATRIPPCHVLMHFMQDLEALDWMLGTARALHHLHTQLPFGAVVHRVGGWVA